MTTLQIQCFLTLAQELNFTKAAKKLQISQSTFSAHISALEKNLQLHLFIRTKRSVRLSPEGEIMLKTFTDAKNMIESGVQVARNLHDHHSKIIRIGYLEGTLVNILANEVLEAFEQSHPDTEVYLARLNNNELITGLNNYELDVIFTRGLVGNGRDDWDSSRLFNTPLSIIYCTHTAPHIHTIEDLNNCTLIQTSSETDGSEQMLWEKLRQQYHLSPRKIIFVKSIEAALLNVEMGRGVYISDHASRAYNSDKFVFFDLENNVNYCCISRKDNPNPDIHDLQQIAESIYLAHVD